MTIGAGGGSGFFLLLIIAFVFLWFILIRPQKKRQLEQQQMLNRIDVGDEVLTAGGIYGEITQIDEDEVRVRIAPDLEVRVARRAIGGVVEREPETDPEAPIEPEDLEHTPSAE